jgi:putative spermidine/putrescine transport system ATP-binding protein
MPSISISNLSKRFGKIRAADSVAFEVKDREYLCILGPTGSGKTSLLRLIAGLLEPDEGEVRFNGVLVNEVNAEDRNAVYVPQTYALFPHLTVVENVMFGKLARGASKADAYDEAIRILGLVRLEHRERSFPNELSGGMQQRVALARGLASGSSLLLLDEPLGALDARLRIDIRAELKQLAKKQNFTVIHVTHDQEEAMTLGDRVLVLRNGALQQHGTSYNVYRKPMNLFVANFVGTTSFFEGNVTSRDASGSTVRLRGELTVGISDTSHQQDEDIVIAVRDENIKIAPIIENLSMDALTGEITAIRFLGSHKRYEIRLSNGDRCASLITTSIRSLTFRIGEKIQVNFNPIDAVVFNYPARGLIRELEVY